MHLESEVQKSEKYFSSCSSEDNYIIKGIILRSRAAWYERAEESFRYFVTLEKRQKSKSSIRKLNMDGVQVEEQRNISQCICTYYRNLLKRTSNLTIRQCKTFINGIHLPILTSEVSDLCEGLLYSSECYQSRISMPSNKTNENGGSDGITEEF